MDGLFDKRKPMMEIKTNAQKIRRFPLKYLPSRDMRRWKTGADHQVLRFERLKGTVSSNNTHTCLRLRTRGARRDDCIASPGLYCMMVELVIT